MSRKIEMIKLWKDECHRLNRKILQLERVIEKLKNENKKLRGKLNDIESNR